MDLISDYIGHMIQLWQGCNSERSTCTVTKTSLVHISRPHQGEPDLLFHGSLILKYRLSISLPYQVKSGSAVATKYKFVVELSSEC